MARRLYSSQANHRNRQSRFNVVMRAVRFTRTPGKMYTLSQFRLRDSL